MILPIWGRKFSGMQYLVRMVLQTSYPDSLCFFFFVGICNICRNVHGSEGVLGLGWVGGSDGEFIENFGLQLKDYSVKRV